MNIRIENNYLLIILIFRILADKRMTLERFKKHLEVILRVPSEYFKLYRQYPTSDDEWNCYTDTLRSAKDGEK